MIRWWVGGLLRKRPGRIAAAASGVATAVALLACLGSFLASSQASMTARAVQGVLVDWQIEVQPGGDPAAALDLARQAPDTRDAVPVGFGRVDALRAVSGSSTRTTGAGVVLGLPDGYRGTFPGELRTLTGADAGVLIAQQTAANLAVGPGDTVTIDIAGARSTPVQIDGVVDIPAANSLFQKVGAPPGGQPTAPPDNVVLLPRTQWQQLFAPLASRTDVVTNQVHVRRSHDGLPTSPSSAFTVETGVARGVEAAGAGTALVGDNLGAALDTARSDAAYAQVMFVFLGIPGAVLAALVTLTVTSAGADRRRAEQALARSRGARSGQLLALAAAEAAVVGVIGAAAGLAAGLGIGQVAFGADRFGATSTQSWSWAAGAAVVGLAIAVACVVLPAWNDMRSVTVAAATRTMSRVARRSPRWSRNGIDIGLVALGAGVVWMTGQNGYQLVLAPEGQPTIAISYWAFAGPALLWIGGGLLASRLVDLVLRSRRLTGYIVAPVAGRMTSTAAATLTRRHQSLTRAIVILGLAVAFAVSTATFNATYRAQAEVDAQLTNGADVAVTAAPGAGIGADVATAVATVPGVRTVEPLQHRFAYIGADLQDLFGVRPGTIGATSALQDAYFQGGTARDLMSVLAADPTSILVSAETATDYQLRIGDTINLRLPDATKQLRTVPFRFAGIVTEFPKAPKDSFFVTNADYVASSTGTGAASTLLVDTGGRDVAAVGDRVRAIVGAGATVTDIDHSRSAIGSGLTAVDVAALTAVEQVFALVLAGAAGGLVLFLEVAERRRGFAITAALGATRLQLQRLSAAEAVVLAVAGLAAGAGIGALQSGVLIAVLSGVFDPPPSSPTVPWPYLLLAAAVTVSVLAVAAIAAGRPARPFSSAIRTD